MRHREILMKAWPEMHHNGYDGEAEEWWASRVFVDGVHVKELGNYPDKFLEPDRWSMVSPIERDDEIRWILHLGDRRR